MNCYRHWVTRPPNAHELESTLLGIDHLFGRADLAPDEARGLLVVFRRLLRAASRCRAGWAPAEYEDFAREVHDRVAVCRQVAGLPTFREFPVPARIYPLSCPALQRATRPVTSTDRA